MNRVNCMFESKYKLNLDIDSASDFVVSSKDAVLKKKNDRLMQVSFDSGKIIREMKFEFRISELIAQYGRSDAIIYLWQDGRKGKYLKFDIDKWQINSDSAFESNRFYPMLPIQDFILTRIGDDVFNYTPGLYSISERKVIWENESIVNPVVISASLFSNSINKVEHFNLETGEMLWSQSVSEIGRHFLKREKQWKEGEVDKFLGVYKKEVWVLLKNGLIIGLDIETGKIIHEIKEPVEYPQSYALFDKELNNFYGKPCMLDIVKGKIIGVVQSGTVGSFPSYYEIDLNVDKVQLKIMQRRDNTFGDFNADGGAIGYAWPFDDDYIYLCDYRNYKLALFNRSTKEIVWVHKMEVDPAKKTFIVKMEVHGNRWYVLDNSKTLYVYERES